MDDGLKQRIVGAVVLIAVAVLFVPALFEPQFQREVDRVTQVPPAPDIKPLTITPPTQPEGIEPAKSPDEMYRLLPETEEEVVQAEARPTAIKLAEQTKILDDRGVPNAWAIQVGSFKEVGRAEALRDKLIKEGFPAFTRKADAGGETITRVFVGPKIQREKAVILKRALDKKLKTNTLLVAFKPG